MMKPFLFDVLDVIHSSTMGECSTTRQSPCAENDNFSITTNHLCARKVKSTLGETFLPDFNLGKKVGRKIALQKGRRAVVLCVVDITDFDGSLPRAALQ